MSAATLRSRRPRSAGSIFAHVASWNARCAAARAWRVSSSVAAGTSAITDWSAGLRVGRVAPSLAWTHWPSMNICSRGLLMGARWGVPTLRLPRPMIPPGALCAASAQAAPMPQGEARVGTSGFVYPHWKGAFYPEDLPQKRWFAHYATRFSTVEVNNTFYRLPSEDVVRAWRDQAPEGFVYAFKASRYLTHRKKLL